MANSKTDAEKAVAPGDAAVATAPPQAPTKKLFAASTNLRVNRNFFTVGSEVDPALFRSEQEVANLIAAGVLVAR